MDGPLTCSDKQPSSINIPLSLVLFFRGSKAILCCRIICCILLDHADPATRGTTCGSGDVLFIFPWKGCARQDLLESWCRHRHLQMQDYLVSSLKSGKKREEGWSKEDFVTCVLLHAPALIHQPVNTSSTQFPTHFCIALALLFILFHLHTVGFSASFLPLSRWVVPWQCERSGRKWGVCANTSRWEKQGSGQTLRDEGRSEKRALCLIFRPKVSSGSLELNRRAARVPLWCDTRANM